jgi:hypothetical protein
MVIQSDVTECNDYKEVSKMNTALIHHSSNKTNNSTMTGSVPELNKKTQHHVDEQSAASMLAKQEVNIVFLVSYTFNIFLYCLLEVFLNSPIF